MNILIRSDSSSTIGLGHIMRDLVLAKRFENDNIAFACQNLQGNIIHKIPYKTHILTSNSHEELIALIKSFEIDMVVFDHYDIDMKFEKQIKQATGVKILSLDDTYEKHYCDILLNHNTYAEPKKYKNLVPASCKLWCGSKYTLIRDEFVKEKKKKRKKEGIAICIGGSDNQNLSLKIAKMLKGNKLSLITTSSNPNLKTLKKYCLEHPNITLYIDTKHIAKILHSSTHAFVSASTIAQEAIYLEVPITAFLTAKNQLHLYRYLKKNRYPCL